MLKSAAFRRFVVRIHCHELMKMPLRRGDANTRNASRFRACRHQEATGAERGEGREKSSSKHLANYCLEFDSGAHLELPRTQGRRRLAKGCARKIEQRRVRID